MSAALQIRKESHLDLVLAGAGIVPATRNGFDALRFEHCALPELDLADIDLSTQWLGKRLAAPLLISSMTGGALRAERINHHLAEAAEVLRIPFGVGSQRVSLEGESDSGLTQRLRDLTPSVPLLSNIGAAQLIDRKGIDIARRALDTIRADALIVHFNPLQEALQPEGDTNWRGILRALEQLVQRLGAPVIVKEVGAGLSAATARRLADAGVAAVDVAGSGGTSWAAIEAARGASDRQRAIAEPFADWGLPTPRAIASVRASLPDMFVIGSGGIRNGVDAAKAIRLGADLVGQAAGILGPALDSTEAVIEAYKITIEQLRISCFCTGAADLQALRQVSLLSSDGIFPS
ncbi:type 2 isopentenyl-diphosphate Delta-isomerase [Tianweitania sp. BSSL-BM11]|uniref:Isopentenyl-diphosphate delta-isomerase n=2 Tax=Tianweitania aestuarii TaxID=2814886 RepID=A0ABS5RS26_9HYPH|nr:type 2 isopentenyl-diphosphate Delta-isomerase [Tianweitania aestuarii]